MTCGEGAGRGTLVSFFSERSDRKKQDLVPHGHPARVQQRVGQRTSKRPH